MLDLFVVVLDNVVRVVFSLEVILGLGDLLSNVSREKKSSRDLLIDLIAV